MTSVLPAAEENEQASRQMTTELDGPVLNAIESFELTLGMGRLFERKDEQIAPAKAGGRHLPKFCGHGLALLLPALHRRVGLASARA